MEKKHPEEVVMLEKIKQQEKELERKAYVARYEEEKNKF